MDYYGGYAIIICIFGILGNIVNIIVFSREKMTARPGNPIPLWLSVSDLFELVVWVWFQCFHLSTWSPFICVDAVLRLHIYLMEVFQTLSICLNITLAFRRYSAVARPAQDIKPREDRSVKLTVASLYALSFYSHLPVFYAVEIVHQSGKCSDRDSIRRLLTEPPVTLILHGVVFRLIPTILLSVISAMFIFRVVMKTHRDHRSLGRQLSHISTQQKRIDRTHIRLTLIVVTMFLIREASIGARLALTNDDQKRLLAVFQQLALLINCSCTMLCYWTTSTPYRETLKSLLTRTGGRVESANGDIIELTEMNSPLRRYNEVE